MDNVCDVLHCVVEGAGNCDVVYLGDFEAATVMYSGNVVDSWVAENAERTVARTFGPAGSLRRLKTMCWATCPLAPVIRTISVALTVILDEAFWRILPVMKANGDSFRSHCWTAFIYSLSPIKIFSHLSLFVQRNTLDRG
jgi:hypothetical protein